MKYFFIITSFTKPSNSLEQMVQRSFGTAENCIISEKNRKLFLEGFHLIRLRYFSAGKAEIVDEKTDYGFRISIGTSIEIMFMEIKGEIIRSLFGSMKFKNYKF